MPLCALFAALVSSSAMADDRLWSYGSSTFRVASETPGELTIRFEHVGNALDREGVVPGTPIFQGTSDGHHLRGASAHFRKACGTLNFDVSGLYDLDGGMIFLAGKIPVRANGCRVERYLDIVMKFTTIEPAQANQAPPTLRPFSKTRTRPIGTRRCAVSPPRCASRLSPPAFPAGRARFHGWNPARTA